MTALKPAAVSVPWSAAGAATKASLFALMAGDCWTGRAAAGAGTGGLFATRLSPWPFGSVTRPRHWEKGFRLGRVELRPRLGGLRLSPIRGIPDPP